MTRIVSSLKIVSMLLLFIMFLNISHAQKCSLGMTPLSASVRATPGQTAIIIWNLYNIYGDRLTHVSLTYTSDVDWPVTFDPALKNVTYDIAGQIVTVTENLALEPNPPVTVKPEVIPPGTNYVKHPFTDEYIPVKTVKISIKIPENAEVWKTHEFTILAEGNCFTAPGAVIPSLSTPLKITLQVVPREFYEKAVLQIPWYVQYSYVIIAIVIIVLLGIIYWSYRRGKKLTQKVSKK
ncbi:MAG: hypothetical protein OH354_01460 [Candidatus Parvarchaeota archaeon]|nr:hypothetical protein [Candidatus Jingweiarchaeum tengchongense]MCW1300072.1 hypothetical protein [Candidatus Jingweiarchaeum tengchongense]MCW1304426.1 hypothetical protein [Candidatus Jingweiarchaeum tengchongense]MCW1305593.1 hypothetical protein [Candidatus Jingweiarchaeum tengchongense]MCW1310974.1 hypothetical protein [Candidatus Jingweiarchaeum tengchongense]